MIDDGDELKSRLDNEKERSTYRAPKVEGWKPATEDTKAARVKVEENFIFQ